MEKDIFDELVGSLKEGIDIVKGERKPSRTFSYQPVQIKSIREKTGTSQETFADLINISPKTLKNWEQGQRVPTGPAMVLLKLLERDPKYIINLLKE